MAKLQDSGIIKASEIKEILGIEGSFPLRGTLLEQGFETPPHKLTDFYGQSSTLTSGEVRFLIPGTFEFTVPEGIRSISAVAVGGGGGGSSNNGSGGVGGGGGGLGWKNNIKVTPFQKITVVVGEGGARSPSSSDTAALEGGDSYVVSRDLVAGLGGKGGLGNINTGGGGNFTGDGGGIGGTGLDSGVSDSTGGGGAGGYLGNGGNSSINGQGSNGQGGGGGGGAAGGSNDAAGGGGPVGIYGIGASGRGGEYGGANGKPGLAGSIYNIDNPFNPEDLNVDFLSGIDGVGLPGELNPGSSVRPATGGFPGGGGGGAEIFGEHGDGASGAVRIMWGDDRSFPGNRANLTFSDYEIIEGSTFTLSSKVSSSTTSFTTLFFTNRTTSVETSRETTITNEDGTTTEATTTYRSFFGTSRRTSRETTVTTVFSSINKTSQGN